MAALLHCKHVRMRLQSIILRAKLGPATSAPAACARPSNSSTLTRSPAQASIRLQLVCAADSAAAPCAREFMNGPYAWRVSPFVTLAPNDWFAGSLFGIQMHSYWRRRRFWPAAASAHRNCKSVRIPHQQVMNRKHACSCQCCRKRNRALELQYHKREREFERSGQLQDRKFKV